MHCNQPFCGNGQNYSHNTYNPSFQNTGIYSEIVGEGEVTSVTLPDGTFQLFFIPTAKWWAPHGVNTFPYFTNIVNTNNRYCGNFGANIGAWFVRTITNPAPPVFTNPMCPQYEAPIPFYTSDCNLNAVNNGCQLKFHNDRCTSTTDIHYFYPRARQFDCTMALPSQGCAAVQVNTPAANNTVCHYEFVCSKPCHCMSRQCHVRTIDQPVSAMSVEDTKTTSKEAICECDSLRLPKPHISNVKIDCEGNKIRKSSSNNIICNCNKPSLNKSSKAKINVCPSSTRKTKATTKDVDCECIFPPFGHSNRNSVISFENTITTSSEVICECDFPSLVKITNSNCKCACCVRGLKHNRNSSRKVTCECNLPSLTKRNKLKAKCACCMCYSKEATTTPNDIICECDRLSLITQDKLEHTKCKCCVCNSKLKATEVICDCDHILLGNQNKCQRSEYCKCDSKTKPKEVICECDRPSVKRNKLKRKKRECCVCNAKSISNEVICECDHPSLVKCSQCDCCVCHSKTKSVEVICECDQSSLSKPNKSKHTKCECCVCNLKTKIDKVICECNKLSMSKPSECGCCVCKLKTRPKDVICECDKPSLSKPRKCGCCVCNSKTRSADVICQCYIPSLSKPTKCECYVCDSETRSNDVICQCDSSKPKASKSKAKSVCCVRGTCDNLQILPTDGRRKRIRLDKRPQRATKTKSKDVICECTPPVCSNKSMATFTDQSCGGDPCSNAEIQSCCQDTNVTKVEEDFVYKCKAEPEMWRPVTAPSRKRFESQRIKYSSESSCSSGSCSGRGGNDEGKYE